MTEDMLHILQPMFLIYVIYELSAYYVEYMTV
jgi:hypothetical protein